MFRLFLRRTLAAGFVISSLGLSACGPAYSPTQATPTAAVSQSTILGLQGFEQGRALQASGPLFTGGNGQILAIGPQQLRIQLDYRTPMGGGFALRNGQISLDIDVQTEPDGEYGVNLTDLYAQKAFAIPDLQQSGSCLSKTAGGQQIEFCFRQSQPGQIALSSSLLSGMSLNIQQI